MPTVWIPSLMQKLTGGEGQIEVEGSTVREVIDNVDARYPGFRDRVCDSDGIKPNLAVAIDGEMSANLAEYFLTRLRSPLNSVAWNHNTFI